MVATASAEELTFDVYCSDKVSATQYAHALYTEDVNSLNLLVNLKRCQFFSDLFGGRQAHGTIVERETVGNTGYSMGFVEFPNKLKVITVIRDTF